MTEGKTTEAMIIADRLKRLINTHPNKTELAELEVFWDDLEQLITTVLDSSLSKD